MPGAEGQGDLVVDGVETAAERRAQGEHPHLLEGGRSRVHEPARNPKKGAQSLVSAGLNRPAHLKPGGVPQRGLNVGSTASTDLSNAGHLLVGGRPIIQQFPVLVEAVVDTDEKIDGVRLPGEDRRRRVIEGRRGGLGRRRLDVAVDARRRTRGERESNEGDGGQRENPLKAAALDNVRH